MVKRKKPKSTLRLAFYRSSHSGIVGKLISWWTSVNHYTWKRTTGRFCHVELIFSDGLSFSAQERADKDGKNYGVRFKRIDYSHPERWVFLDVKSALTEKEIRERAESIVGQPYDWLGIIFYEFLPLKKENKKAWYCSECASYALGIANPHISPNVMFDIVVDNNFNFL